MNETTIPSAMPGFGKVAATAFVVAEYRAEENTQPNPLYRDPVVAIFLDETTRQAAASAAAPSPAARKGVRLRTRYLDDVLDRRIASGCRQVVILGSGLDTRAVRKRAAGVTYFEIDDRAILEFKQSRLIQCGIAAEFVPVPGDYVGEDWIGALARRGFDADLPTHVIWEGNTMYLAMNDLVAVLATVRDRIARATVSFDYLAQDMVDKTTGDRTLSDLAERFERIGAPWITGIADIRALARRLDLALLDDVSVADLHQRHWPALATGTGFFGFYSLCTLANQGHRPDPPRR